MRSVWERGKDVEKLGRGLLLISLSLLLLLLLLLWLLLLLSLGEEGEWEFDRGLAGRKRVRVPSVLARQAHRAWKESWRAWSTS